MAQSNYDPEAFSKNLGLVLEKMQRASAQMVSQQGENPPAMTPQPDVAAAFFEVGAKLMSNPKAMWEAQVELAKEYFELWKHTMSKLAGEET